MGRLTLDLSRVPGRDSEEQVYDRDMDGATERFVSWFDCWATA